MTSLFELLPRVHRLRDAAQGDPLRALLTVVDREVQAVEDDISRLYDNWFIETCDEWAVPYIGDLLGVRALTDGAAADGPSVFSQRSYVANTLAYRRRKGTAAVLEQLARDLTGWRAKVVEFFEHTAATQHVNHPRPAHAFTVDVRSSYESQFHGTPFARAAHLAEVRHIDNGRGRYNARNVAIFLWRLQSHGLHGVSARRIDATRYTFDPLGRDVALFTVPRTATSAAPVTRPVNVPMPLTRLILHHDRETYYGSATERSSLLVSTGGVAHDAGAICVCDLSDAGTGWAHGAPPGRIAVDPELGRIAFDGPPAGEVTVGYACGLGGDLGGGPYDRRPSLNDLRLADVTWQMGVVHDPPPGQTQIVASLAEAVQAWNDQPPGTSGVIALLDSRTYAADLTTAARRIAIPEGSRLLVVAAGWPPETIDGAPHWRTGQIVPSDVRPHVQGTIEVVGTAPAGSAAAGHLVLNGLLIEGTLKVREGHLGALTLSHCTLAPGMSALVCAANPALVIDATRAICGDLVPAGAARALHLRDCIVTGRVHGRDVRIEASTVLGTTEAQTLHASNSILLENVTVQRRQEGCVRYSYLPFDSASPRRYRCQPATTEDAAHVRPRFESIHYGEPAFAQLAGACATAIVSGADDEGEMGAWHFVQAPLRVRALRQALEEYVRFGLEAGVFTARQQPASLAPGAEQDLVPPTEDVPTPARAGATSRRTSKRGAAAARPASVRKRQAARPSRRSK